MKALWEAIKAVFARDYERMRRFDDETFHCEHRESGTCGEPYCEALAQSEAW